MRWNTTTIFTFIASAFFLFIGSQPVEARRWRFAVPFPGLIEPSFPEGTTSTTPKTRTFEDMDKQETIFDTKVVSRREDRPKVVIDQNQENQDNKGKMFSPGQEFPPNAEILLESSHNMPWIL